MIMKEKEIIIKMQELSYDELSDRQKKLVDLAREATNRSYAPYSHFCVGAAIELSNGEIVTGANQENAAFPSGTCAERTAAFYAHAAYPEARFKAIAIAAVGTDGKEIPDPVAPCGACRQSLLEFETLAKDNVEVILVGSRAIYVLPSVKSTLPLAFSEF